MNEIDIELEKTLLETLRKANIAVASEYLHDENALHILQFATQGESLKSVCNDIYNKLVPHFNTINPPELKEMFLAIIKDYLQNYEKCPASIVNFLDHINISLTKIVYEELKQVGALSTLVPPHERSGNRHPVILKMNLLITQKEAYNKMVADYTTINNFITKLQQDCSMHGSSQTLDTYSTNYNIDLMPKA